MRARYSVIIIVKPFHQKVIYYCFYDLHLFFQTGLLSTSMLPRWPFPSSRFKISTNEICLPNTLVLMWWALCSLPSQQIRIETPSQTTFALSKHETMFMTQLPARHLYSNFWCNKLGATRYERQNDGKVHCQASPPSPVLGEGAQCQTLDHAFRRMSALTFETEKSCTSLKREMKHIF